MDVDRNMIRNGMIDSPTNKFWKEFSVSLLVHGRPFSMRKLQGHWSNGKLLKEIGSVLLL